MSALRLETDALLDDSSDWGSDSSDNGWAANAVDTQLMMATDAETSRSPALNLATDRLPAPAAAISRSGSMRVSKFTARERAAKSAQRLESDASSSDWGSNSGHVSRQKKRELCS